MQRHDKAPPVYQTRSGIPLQASYGPGDVPEGARGVVGLLPGQAPYHRGCFPQGYRTKPWRIFQLSGFGKPEDENERIKFLLKNGETGFLMEHDRNTADHLYNVDHPDVVARREDVGHAWLEDAPARHPAEGDTQPLADKPGAYSWNKAPRLAGAVLETGALARQLVAGQPLLRELAARGGANVLTRVLARLLELALVVPQMERWLAELRPGEPYHRDAALPDCGSAVGLHEAARGALGHWLRVEHGRIAHYQIIAPTTWNFSPRDAAGRPGALERALEGAPVQPGERTPVAVQHIVRSFDPCMVCTVH